ncbi:M48 family metallopeptidase [Sedimentitalea nanhaiensis]|uniref:YgjP-like metallopeptidase domain-containing protein n=1 Tax=Sedimentitalea nanhaiensis TaxID=999627 RepID=A0A1I7E3X2_9RHOB|nr:SprT family zinc-dependent metalloprotease [Sedimentitalea nanhaiensis]SFU18632.1 hypothetical protein SAMN05216236_14324 [Sedimentitalea nanhaiensis]
MSAEVCEVAFGQNTITFDLVRRERKTLSISVHPDLAVEVLAPTDASFEKIAEKVLKRAPWIQNQLKYFAQFQPRTPKRSYVAGETHLYLGRQYKLKVVPHIQNGVKMLRGQIMVNSTKPRNQEHTRDLVRDWMLKRAQVKFSERLEICRGRFADPEAVVPAGLLIRDLSQRWGSMTARRNLVLNRSLIGASTDSIDYVITHELCHIEYQHHGTAFYEHLGRVMPDWERRKTKLERQLA